MNHLNNIHIRVYIDYSRNIAYIIGFIFDKEFFNDVITIKKMVRFNKSEKAIYLALNLEKGHPIKSLFEQLGKEIL